MAWTRYKTDYASHRPAGDDFAGLLAIRLAYEAALSQQSEVEIRWETFPAAFSPHNPALHRERYSDANDVSIRYLLLRASEIHYSRRNY